MDDLLHLHSVDIKPHNRNFLYHCINGNIMTLIIRINGKWTLKTLFHFLDHLPAFFLRGQHHKAIDAERISLIAKHTVQALCDLAGNNRHIFLSISIDYYIKTCHLDPDNGIWLLLLPYSMYRLQKRLSVVTARIIVSILRRIFKSRIQEK